MRLRDIYWYWAGWEISLCGSGAIFLTQSIKWMIPGCLEEVHRGSVSIELSRCDYSGWCLICSWFKSWSMLSFQHERITMRQSNIRICFEWSYWSGDEDWDNIRIRLLQISTLAFTDSAPSSFIPDSDLLRCVFSGPSVICVDMGV